MTKVFVSAVGQEGNIGDSVLRRAYLAALRTSGELHVLVERNSKSYQTGLHLNDQDVTYVSRAQWWEEAFACARSERIVVGYNAGEMQLNSKFVKSYAKHVALVSRAVPQGGYGLHVGMGVRAPRRGFGRTIGLLLRASRIISWRDRESAAWTGVGEVHPDWAFDLGSSVDQFRPSAERGTLALSLRGDREAPDEEWYETVRLSASRSNLEPIVVVQVDLDQALGERMANRLNCRLVPWNGAHHEEHERVVRDVYASSAAVMSDRLHSLIMGLTEGARPISYSVEGSEKIDRTLGAVGAETAVQHASNRAERLKTISKLLSDTDSPHHLVRAARQDLSILRGRITSA